MDNEKVEQRAAKQGEKMIELRIRFWTDSLADEKGKILPKHAWASGVVGVQANKSHGISPQDPVPFNSIMELMSAIEKVILAQGITLHTSRKMRKYFDSSKR